MIRGVSFQIPQETSNMLWQILKCVDTEKYHWYNIKSQNEVWDSSHTNGFFALDYYAGKHFSELICLNHYILFIKLQAYIEKNEFYDIHSYEEFIQSNCQILILVYDCEYVEIYTKDLDITNALYRNAFNQGFTEVEYITEINDNRTKIDIL